MDRPKYQERDYVPRRVMISASVVGRFGPSPGCMECHFLSVGGNRHPHTEACRSRLVTLMSGDTECAKKVQASRNCIDYFLEKTIRETDAKRRRMEEASQTEAKDTASTNKRSTTPYESDEVVGTKRQRVAVEGESSSDQADVDDHMAVSSVDLLPLWVVPCEDHDEDFARVAGENEDEQAYDLEFETHVQGFEGETTFLDDRTGKVLDSTAVLAARREEL